MRWERPQSTMNNSNAQPPFRELVMQDRLHQVARSARAEAGLTQQQVADRLGVTNASVSRAETRAGGRYLNLQRRMIEEIAGFELRGPLWEITKPAA